MRQRPALLLLVALAAGPGPARGEDLLGEAARSEAAVEEQVRAVLVHRLEEDTDALAADRAALERLDDAREAAGLPPTGLADNVGYLAAGIPRARDARRRALDDVLDHHPDPMVRRLAQYRLDVDDAVAADRLLADDRHNRRAAVLNDAVRPLGIFSGAAFAAVINPFLLAGSAVDSLATTAVNLWHYNRLSTPEREALARYRTLLAREPRTEDAPDIAHAIRRLGAKRAKAVCEQTTAAARKALEADDLDRAAFYARSAAALDDCAERAEEPLDDVNEARARRAAREDAGRWPADEPRTPRPGLETLDYEDLLVATAAGEPGPMSEAASRFTTRYADSEVAPSAAYTLAVARDLAGHRDAARSALEELASDDDSGAGRRAAALLANPTFSQLDALHDAEGRHRREQVRYVLLGRPDGRTALYTAAKMGGDAAGAAQTLGIFNVIGVLTRAWQTWRKDPVSNQEIIDRGEQFLAREPGSPEAPAVHRRLAEAYERAEVYSRALMHLRATPDASPKAITRLQEKLADQLLTEAERGDGDPAMLALIVEHFADTPAATKARQRLEARPDTGATVLGREVLRAHPTLLAADALDIDPRLLDGDRDNGELADAGVTLVDGTLRLSLESDGDDRVETRTLTPAASARARSAAQEALYTDLVTADGRDPETGRFERYIPVFLQGSLGGDGVSVYPGVKLRRYRSTDQALYE